LPESETLYWIIFEDSCILHNQLNFNLEIQLIE